MRIANFDVTGLSTVSVCAGFHSLIAAVSERDGLGLLVFSYRCGVDHDRLRHPVRQPDSADDCVISE